MYQRMPPKAKTAKHLDFIVTTNNIYYTTKSLGEGGGTLGYTVHTVPMKPQLNLGSNLNQ